MRERVCSRGPRVPRGVRRTRRLITSSSGEDVLPFVHGRARSSRDVRSAPPASPILAVSRKDLPPERDPRVRDAPSRLALIAALFAVLSSRRPARRHTDRLHCKGDARRTPTRPPRRRWHPPRQSRRQKARTATRFRGPGASRRDSTDRQASRKSTGTDRTRVVLEGDRRRRRREHAQTFRVLSVMKDLRDFNHCNPRDQFAALVDRASKKVVAFEYAVNKEEVYQARARTQPGSSKNTKLDLAVERNAGASGSKVWSASTGRRSRRPSKRRASNRTWSRCWTTRSPATAR